MANRRKLSHQQQEAIATPPFSEIGVTGLDRDLSGHVWDEWLTDLRGTQRAARKYREMTDNNAICGSTDHAYTTWATQTPRTISPAEETPAGLEVSDYIESCLDDMSSTWQELMGEAISSAVFGWSLHEEVYKRRCGQNQPPELRSKHNDGRVGLRKLPRRYQETIERWEFEDDGGILGAYQQAPPHWGEKFIPLSRGALFRTRSNKNNPEGRSIFRSAYRSWYFLKKIEEYEAIGISKDMTGVLAFRLPPEYFDENASTDQKNTLASFQKLVQKAQRGEYEGLVFPSADVKDGKTGFDAHLMNSGGRKPMDVDGVIKRLESRVAISVLNDGVLLGMQGNVGSWSLADIKFRMSTLAINAILDGIAGVFNRFVFPRLVDINGWPAELSPTLEFGEIDAGDMATNIPSIVAALQAGAMSAGPALEEHMRMALGIPREEEPSLGQFQDALGEFNELEDGEQDAQIAGASQEVIPIEEEKGTHMTVDEVAESLGISSGRVKAAIKRGEIPGVKVGNSWSVSRAEFLDWHGRRHHAGK